MVTLSNYYQTSSPSHPIPLPAPTYEKYLSEDPDLDADYIDQAFPYLSYLAIDCTAEEYAKRQQEIVDRTSRVDFSFSKDQIQAISAEVRQGEKIQMSTMDILAAYVISVIQRISPTPVKQIRLVAGVRPLIFIALSVLAHRLVLASTEGRKQSAAANTLRLRQPPLVICSWYLTVRTP